MRYIFQALYNLNKIQESKDILGQLIDFEKEINSPELELDLKTFELLKQRNQ